MLEKEVEKYLKTNIERIGGKCLKFNSPGNNGVPDRLVLLPGSVSFFVELKRPGEKPRKLQEKVIRDFRSLGHTVFVISSKEGVDLMFESLKSIGLIEYD